MAKLSKAFALLLLFAAWFLPAQIASAAPAGQHPTDLSASIRHQEDGEDEFENEDENEDEDEDEDEGDDDGKQFAPPPLVVKHKSMSGHSDDKNTKGSSSSKGSKLPFPIAGAVPSSETTLLRAASLGIVTLEQVFAKPEYVTSAVNGTDAGTSGAPDDSSEPRPIPTGAAVNPTLNEPVVKSIGLANYEDPASEFMHKAYFGLAILGAGAIAMTAHAISNARKTAQSDENDYEYEAQN